MDQIVNVLNKILIAITALNSGKILLPAMTTAQKAALTAVAGQMVFDTTLGKACVYTGAAWQTITSV